MGPLMGLLGLLWQLLVGRAARRDAEHSLNSADARITRAMGSRPILDPVARQDHAQVVSGLTRRVEVEEWSDDLRRVQTEAARHTSPGVILLLLAGALAVEVVGAMLVMKGMDLPALERVALGTALAFGLIGLTYMLAMSRHPMPTGDGSPPPQGGGSTPPPSPAPASRLVPAVYSAVVLALAIIRLHGADDDLSQAELYSQAVVMLVATIGPAWAAEWLLRRYAPTRLLAREMKLLKTRIREAQRAHGRAERFTAELSRNAARWDEEAMRLRAAYEIEHRLASAELPEQPATNRRQRRTS